MQEFFCALPSDAGVGDALTVHRGVSIDEVLSAFNKMTFEHDTKNRCVTIADLTADVITYVTLLGELVATIGVTEIDHDFVRDTSFGQHLRDLFDVRRIVVWLFSSPQDGVANRRGVPRHDYATIRW